MAARRGREVSFENNAPSCPELRSPPIEPKGEFPPASNEKGPVFGPSTGKPAHVRAANLLACALTLDTEAAWNSASAVWALRLTKGERAAIALAALDSLAPGDATKIMETAMGGQGMPVPAFLDPTDNAAWWADLASLPELRAYCRAAFLAMPEREKRAFLDFVREARS